MSGDPPKSAREEIRDAVTAAVQRGTYDPHEDAAFYTLCIPSIVDILLARVERQAAAIVRLETRLRELDSRTRGLVRVGGR